MRVSQRDSGNGLCHFALRCVIGALCIGFSLVGSAWAQPRIPPLPVLPSVPVAVDASSKNTTAASQAAVEFFDYTKMLPPDPADPAHPARLNGVPNNQLKGRVYLPTADPTKLTGVYPVVIFLHGMHGVCGRPLAPTAKGTVGAKPAGLDSRAGDPPLQSAPGKNDGLIAAAGAAPPIELPGYCPEEGQLGDVICPPLAGGKLYDPRVCPPEVAKAPPAFPDKVTWTEIPNYLGYDYLAKRLASQGYICLSIDANLINEEQWDPGKWAAAENDSDPGRIRERGQVVLQHLVQLYNLDVGNDTLPATKTLPTTTNKGGTTLAAGFLKGKLDLTNVALVGHSRGGEGVRAAYNLYWSGQDYTSTPTKTVAKNWMGMFPASGKFPSASPLGIKAIYEIAPTDLEGDQHVLVPVYAAQGKNIPDATPLNATVSMGGNKVQGTAWNVLLPSCDGDVSDNSGIRPFDRMTNQMGQTETMPTPKSVYAVWGANHNFFNQQWTLSETADRRAGAAWTWTHVGCSVAPPETTNPQIFTNDVDAGAAKNGADPGAVSQRTTTLSSVTALMLANVGSKADPTLNQNFNTLYQTPAGAKAVTDENGIMAPYPPSPIADNTKTTRIERSYIPAVDKGAFLLVDNFSALGAGPLTSTPSGSPNDSANLTSDENLSNANLGKALGNIIGLPGLGAFPNPDKGLVFHDVGQTAALLKWDSTAGTPFLQTNLTKAAPVAGVNVLANYTTLQFRVGRELENPPTLNKTQMTTNFSVQLVGPTNNVDPTDKKADSTGTVQVGKYTQVGEIRGPAGVSALPTLNPNWQTIRIPLTDFPPINNFVKAAVAEANVHGVRFTFQPTKTGAIYLADVRFTPFGLGANKFPAVGSRRVSNEIAANAWGDPSMAATPVATPTPGATQLINHPATLNPSDITASSSLDILSGAPGVEIPISSDDGFPASNELPILTIGGTAFDFTGLPFFRSRYPRSDDGTITFTLTIDEYTSALNEQSSAGTVEAYVHYGFFPSYEVWDLRQVALPSLASLGIVLTPTPVATATP